MPETSTIDDAVRELRALCHAEIKQRQELLAILDKFFATSDAAMLPAGAHENTGLQRAILLVISASTEPLRAIQVAERVMAAGYVYKGRWPFGTNVATALHRMRRAGTVVQTGKMWSLVK